MSWNSLAHSGNIKFLSAGLVLLNLGILQSHSSYANERPVLEEVIVTAQKRAQSLQDVPVAVSVIDGEKIREAGITILQEMTQYVPNFYQTVTPTANIIYIRGIGSGPNIGFEQSVGMFHDGIYWGRGRQTLAPLFDLQNVQILKGPQGVLFGKNTVAGAVITTSARPSNTTEGFISMSAGSRDDQKFEAAIGGQLLDTLSGRLSLFYNGSDGWVKNAFTNDDEPNTIRDGMRLGLNFEPNDALTAYLKMEWSGLVAKGQPYEVSQSNPLALSIQFPPIFDSQTVVPPHLADEEARVDGHSNIGNTTIPGNNGIEAHTNLSNHLLQIDWESEKHLVTSVTGYSSYLFVGKSDLDFSPEDVLGIDSREHYTQLSQELRIASSDGDFFNYVGGVYIQSSELEIDTFLAMKVSTILGPILNNELLLKPFTDNEGFREMRYDMDSESASAFLQGTFNISDDFRITLGGRYTYESKDLEKEISTLSFSGQRHTQADVDALNSGNLPAAEEAELNAVLNDFWEELLDIYPYLVNRERTENNFTPEIKFEWNVDADSLLYFSATRGFKSGGFDHDHGNGTKVDYPKGKQGGLEFTEEKANALELGAKLVLMDNRANINIAIYQTKFEDQQVSIYNGTNAFNVGNAGSATSRGMEIEGRFIATERLELSASVAYTDFAYDSYKDGQCTTADQAAHLIENGTVEAFTNGTVSDCPRDLSGAEAAYSPDWNASVSFTHNIPLSAQLLLLSTLDLNYSGEYFLSPDLDPATLQDGYTVVNARIALVSEEQWRIALTGKNLTDERIMYDSDDIPFGNGNFYANAICREAAFLCENIKSQIADDKGAVRVTTGAPRSYGIDVSYRF